MSTIPAYTGDDHLNSIIHAALKRVDPEAIIEQGVTLDGNTLTIRTETEHLAFDLGKFDRLLLLGLGKAAARSARAMESLLGGRIDGGVVVTKRGHAEKLERVELFEAGHPVPDEAGVAAAERMLELLSGVDEKTLCITLVSGGGSALLVAPYADSEKRLTLDQIQETTRLLLACGATIQEINCIRKHLSRVKGGRLAALMAPATSVNLILSDVIGDDPASIASGITAPDPTTYQDARHIAEYYGIMGDLPAAVREVLEAGGAGEIPETPKPGDALFKRIHNVVIGSNKQALLAASTAARELGYNTSCLTSLLNGEAREVGKLFPAIARDILQDGLLTAPPACVLAGGETTVTLAKEPGKGGRNQEMVVSALREMCENPEAYRGVTFASVGTDGNDGPTDSAGGWVSHGIIDSAAKQRGALSAALSQSNAYPLLDSLGAHIRTGPTNTNVCDIQVLLVRNG